MIKHTQIGQMRIVFQNNLANDNKNEEWVTFSEEVDQERVKKDFLIIWKNNGGRGEILCIHKHLYISADLQIYKNELTI